MYLGLFSGHFVIFNTALLLLSVSVREGNRRFGSALSCAVFYPCTAAVADGVSLRIKDAVVRSEPDRSRVPLNPGGQNGFGRDSAWARHSLHLDV